MTARSQRLLLVVVGIVALATSLFPDFSLPGRFAALWFYIGYAASLLVLFLSAWFAHRNALSFSSENPARLPWRLLSLGLSAFLIGDLIYAYYELVLSVQTPLASLAEVFYFASTMMLVLAELAFLQAYRKTGLPIDFRLEVGLTGLAAGMIGLAGTAVFVLPIFRRSEVRLEELIHIAHPLTKVVLLSLAVILLRITWKLNGGRVWHIWLALVLGLLALWVADLLFAYTTLLEVRELQVPADLAYLLSYLLLAEGSLRQRELMGEAPGRRDRARDSPL